MNMSRFKPNQPQDDHGMWTDGPNASPIKDTVPFSSAYYAKKKATLKETWGGVPVDNAAEVEKFHADKVATPGHGGSHYYDTAVARRMTRLKLGTLGGDHDNPGQIERYVGKAPTVGEIMTSSDDELRAMEAHAKTSSAAADAKWAATHARPATPPWPAPSGAPRRNMQLFDREDGGASVYDQYERKMK